MARKSQENPALDMTPMIDVVFEMIIFFVVTIKQEDIFAKLNANRPAPSEGKATESAEPPVEVQIGKGRNANGVILYNKRAMKDASALKDQLKEVAKTDKTTSIIVRCSEDSPHKALVDVLDVCYSLGLYSVSIFTM